MRNRETPNQISLVKTYTDSACEGQTETKLIHATAELIGRRGTQTSALNLRVPAHWELKDWLVSLIDLVRERAIAENFTGLCAVRCQIDGGNKPYTFWRKLQDFWYSTTWRGRPFTTTRCVPIWPRSTAR